MKHIVKQKEPPSFTAWKAKANDDWQPTYSDLRNPEKRDVLQALLQEQGHICCYCGMRLTARDPSMSNDQESETNDQTSAQDGCHIEHLKPQSQYPEFALDYDNMLASCQAEDTKNPRLPLRCGQKKANWYDPTLMVSPLMPDCETFFRYTGSGEILPSDDPSKHEVAKTTIQELGLDITRLNSLRKRAIATIDEQIIGTSEEDIVNSALDLISTYDIHDPAGMFSPFCFVVVSYLKANYL
ncbi:MAG: TIGR02646 family protein [Cyanothece sp. SIO2G6]|nr:TIGR02646 family protein [Cyanothece sp. SIO2G6]